MKTYRIFLYMGCLAALCAMSCTTDGAEEIMDEYPGEEENVVLPEMPEDPGDADDDELRQNTQVVSYANAVSLLFAGENVSIDNPFEGKGVTIESKKGHVTITSTREDVELNYILSGITSDGSVKIYGKYKFGLVLNGVGITNPRGAAINIQCGKKITVTVVDKTSNRLIDGKTYEFTDGEDMKAAFFSEGQLNMYGKGRLEVRGKYKHAICTDDYFRMYEGDIWIKEAAGDGIHANDDVLIASGTLNIRSAGDGIESEKDVININGGSISVVTTGEKGHAIKSKGNTTVDSDDAIEINVYGNASKGFSAGGDMTIKKGDITINTAGNAFYEKEEADISSAAGIKCDGNLTIEKADITILSSGQGGKGISADGTLTIHDGKLTVFTTGKQYVYDRNNDTAAKAIKCDGDMVINGGTILIQTTGAEAEGLESKTQLTIKGGNIQINAYDDCINAAKHIQIDGGHIYCNSATNDGIDSNGTLTITGGTIVSAGASQPEEGFDCDQNRFTITGGILLGIGGGSSMPTASSCTQRALVYGATTASLRIIHIESAKNKDVLTFMLPKTYAQRTTLLFSSPALEADNSYTLYTGGSISGETDFHGFYTGAAYTGGTAAGTFTTAAMVTTLGNTGGGPGGPRW
jgi:hypothetical protein